MKKVIEELLDEVQEFGIDAGHPELEMPCIDNEKVTEHLAANNVNWLPVRVGQTIYKICPICNPNHNGSCKRCAWSGCFGSGCDVGVGVCFDGSHGNYDLQIIPKQVIDTHIVMILKWWNVMYFATEAEAQKAMKEYMAIRNIEDRTERYHRYKEWENDREYHFTFLEKIEEVEG